MEALLEERVDRLEALLGHFLVSTGNALSQLSNEMRAFKDEMHADRMNLSDETKAFKDSTGNAISQLSNEMKVFKDEMRADRVNLSDETTAFKEGTGNALSQLSNEMKAFKDEMRADRVSLNKQWGQLANKMGTVVEDIVAPNIPRIAREFFHIEELELFAVRVQKRNRRDRSLKREFDVIAVSDQDFILNETKATPKMEYINDFITILRQIEDYFPEIKGKKMIPIFSSLYLAPDVIGYLTKHRIYAMGMADETMEILNFQQMREE